jgi:hypothetical protein
MMIAPEHDTGEGEPGSHHIPGSGIDFIRVGRVQVIALDDVGSRGVPSWVVRGTALQRRERLVRIEGYRLDVGDLAVTMRETARGISLSRPMQVRRVVDGFAYALDDQSLRRRWVCDPYTACLCTEGPAAPWHLLDQWSIFRCPRCRAPGLVITWGLATGPAGPGATLGSCVITFGEGDVECSKCRTRWYVRPPVDAAHSPSDLRT